MVDIGDFAGPALRSAVPPFHVMDVLSAAQARQRSHGDLVSLAAGESPLTARERDVLITARTGATVAEIAMRLYLTEGTVRNYVSAAIAKTGARNRVEAVRIADDRGWL